MSGHRAGEGYSRRPERRANNAWGSERVLWTFRDEYVILSDGQLVSTASWGS